ncbi:hypothetical protein JXA48_03240 [Candidatus Woesearchaeota archaeon]|nr:hypothetical protein [Candidatus Woesearchaeota archaeon]
MSEENKGDTLEDVQILNKISKRLDIIEETNIKLKETQEEQLRTLESQRKRQGEEIEQFQKECKEIEEGFRSITKSIFEIGRQLKDKVSKDELEFLKNETDKWPLENFITKKELEKTYNYYKENS